MTSTGHERLLETLPEPDCRYGYPIAQVREHLGDNTFATFYQWIDRQTVFYQWIDGQTVSVCDGREYDHELRQYYETGCGPHGLVYYPWNVQSFLLQEEKRADNKGRSDR